jgi:type II secretion system protein H
VARTKTDRNLSQRGVTLLELLVVVALASILLAVVFPSVGAGLRTLELRSAAQQLAASARYAREQAIHRQRFYELEIDAEAGTISVGDLARNGPALAGSAQARRSFELPATVRVERISPEERDSPPRRRFLFSPDGGAPAFEIVLGNDRRLVVVTSDPLTGFPKVTEL